MNDSNPVQDNKSDMPVNLKAQPLYSSEYTDLIHPDISANENILCGMHQPGSIPDGVLRSIFHPPVLVA